MRVVFTPSARESLRDISNYIEQFSKPAARRTRNRLFQRARQLESFPASGRVVPEFNEQTVRELVEGPYRIWYRLRDDRIEILAVLHGARDVK